jgi:two-component system, chemotaxis family, protein-glutamate methylesterase/glutaminase
VIRVLIVDDSAVLRQSTKFILQSDPTLQVVGEATDGAEAIALVNRLQPDVVTMDVRMPKVDGAGAIREIMAEHPVPIIVVTGADLELETELVPQLIKLGAVSVVKRPVNVTNEERNAFALRLIEQVKLMSGVKVIRHLRSLPFAPHIAPPARETSARTRTEVVVIGASTGGPAALHKILSAMPADFSLPIVIVQHISFGFVEGLASWLNDASPLRVQIGQQGERMQPGVVYVAPDDRHLTVDAYRRLALTAAEPMGGHRPAVTALFQSAARSYGAAALAVLLTGMGADGALGMKALYDAGAITLAQDQASCVVFGMPKEAIALNAVKQIVPLDRIARTIQELIVV